MEKSAIVIKCFASTPNFISLYACNPNYDYSEELSLMELQTEASKIVSLTKDPDSVFFLPTLDNNALVKISGLSLKYQTLVLENISKKDTYYIYAPNVENLYHKVHKAFSTYNVNYFINGNCEMAHFPFSVTKLKNLGPGSRCFYLSIGDFNEYGKLSITLLPGVVKNVTEEKYVIEIDTSLNGGRDYFKSYVYKSRELVFPENEMVAYT